MSDRSMAVVGAGTMGVGIAYVFAAAGFATWVVEPDDAGARRLEEVIAAQARAGVARGKLSTAQGEALPGRVRRLATVEELPDGLELAVETVPERLELKCEVLARIARRTPQLLASNTSSLSIDRLAAALGAPDTFLGMHFFNPVWSLSLVEVIRGVGTAPAAVEHARELVGAIGKQEIVVRDVPGFATSRLDLIASLEAMRMVEDGVASPEDIDRAATLAYRHPVGPLRLSDIVGLDVRLDISESLQREYGERYAPPRLLREMVAEGRLGQKSGLGFYEWP